MAVTARQRQMSALAERRDRDVYKRQVYVLKTRGRESAAVEDLYGDEDIIELWGDGA